LRRGGEYDEMISPLRNEMRWDSIWVVVGINQCPNADLKITGREVLWYNEDTFFHKKVEV